MQNNPRGFLTSTQKGQEPHSPCPHVPKCTCPFLGHSRSIIAVSTTPMTTVSTTKNFAQSFMNVA